MKKFIIIILLLMSSIVEAATYTQVTATLTDNTGQPWANATITAQLMPPFGNPAPLINGGIAPITPVRATADAAGTFVMTLDDNLALKPSGSTWNFIMCPNATVSACSQGFATVTGTTQDISSTLSSFLSNIQVIPSPFANRAYSDDEMSSPSQGALYWRVTDNILRGWDGTQWVNVGGGGGGSTTTTWDAILSPTQNATIVMGNFDTTIQFGNATGALPMWMITDGTNNTGTGPLFLLKTGTGSSAQPFGVCAKGNSDCVMMNNLAMFEAIGNAQIIATSVQSNVSGVGTLYLGSNGTGTTSGTNQVTLTGNNNKLYASEDQSALFKIPLVVYKNGASISHTGTTTSDNIYSVTGMPAQLTDGAFKVTMDVNIQVQGAGNSTLEVRAGALTLYSMAIPNGWNGDEFKYTLECSMRNSQSTEYCIASTNNNAPANNIITFNLDNINLSAPWTLNVVITSANNTDHQNFQSIIVEEL